MRQTIPKDVNSFLVGWPCTDVSNMSKYARTQTNRCCVASGGLRSGGVFKSVIDFCCNHGSEVDFLGNENVPALATPPPDGGPDNLTAAVWLLDTHADMYTKTWQLNPMMFGVPQSRDRLWFPSFRRKVLRDLKLSDQEADSILTSIMQRIVGSQLADIGLYLFPPGRDILQQVLETMPTADHTGSSEVQRKWLQQHLKCFEAKGLKWWDTKYPSEETCASYPFLRCIHLREFDLLHLSGVAECPKRAAICRGRPVACEAFPPVARLRAGDHPSHQVLHHGLVQSAHRHRGAAFAIDPFSEHEGVATLLE